MAGVTFARRTLLRQKRSRVVTNRQIGFEKLVDSQSQNANLSAREVEFTDTDKHGRRVVCPASQKVIDQQRQLGIKPERMTLDTRRRSRFGKVRLE